VRRRCLPPPAALHAHCVCARTWPRYHSSRSLPRPRGAAGCSVRLQRSVLHISLRGSILCDAGGATQPEPPADVPTLPGDPTHNTGLLVSMRDCSSSPSCPHIHHMEALTRKGLGAGESRGAGRARHPPEGRRGAGGQEGWRRFRGPSFSCALLARSHGGHDTVSVT
jgi:hypothetical protein